MNIRLNFIGTICPINALIYDEQNNIIYNKTFNGSLEVVLKPNKIYKLIATIPCSRIIEYFYVNHISKYNFIFPALYINNFTFSLTDYFYPKLPIERGEIILWPKQ